MPRTKGNGEGTFNKTPSGWRLRAFVENPLTHIKERRTFCGKTQAECRRKCRDYSEGRSKISANATVKNFGEFWLENFVRPRVQTVTFDTYCFETKKIFNSFLGSMDMSDVKQLHIQKFFNDNSSYSKSSLKKCRSYINNMFECALDNDIVLKNPCRKITIPIEAGTAERRALTDDEISTVKEFACKDDFGFAIFILLYAGLRKGELRGLKFSQLDTENRIIRVMGAMDRYDCPVSTAANKNHSRDIPIPTFVNDLLSLKQGSGYVLTNCDTPMSENQFRAAYSAFFKRLGKHCVEQSIEPVRQVSPHELRHTYSTLCYRKNINPITVKELLGHQTVDMTARYTHDDLLTKQRAIDSVF